MMLNIRLRDRTAKDLVALGEKHEEVPAFRELVQVLQGALGPVAGGAQGLRRTARSFAGVRQAREPRRQATPTGDVRREIWLRSEGRCECGCGRRITWATMEMDHFLGRAKWPESAESCWALARECHRAKTDKSPTALRWLWLFLLHLQAHGFGQSATASEVLGQLEGGRLIQKAEQLRAGGGAQR
jgi:5-methylcytosine-specific restriction endonuclease McrA